MSQVVPPWGLSAMRTCGLRIPHRLLALLLVGISSFLASCGTPEGTTSRVTVLGSWTGSEADAFQAVLRPFEERTGIRVDYTMTRDLHGAIDDGLADGHPPDLAGLEGPSHLRELASDGVLKDLGEAIDPQVYKTHVPPTFVEFGSVDGRLLGVFLKATLKGLVWYDPQVFRRGTPTSFSDLQWMSDDYRGAETRQWCVGLASQESSGWPGTDLIESFLINQSGVDVYDAWANAELPWTAPQVQRAFEAYGQLVADDAVFGGAGGGAPDPVRGRG